MPADELVNHSVDPETRVVTADKGAKRVAVGIEAAQDLWDDFEQALDASAPQSEVVAMEDS